MGRRRLRTLVLGDCRHVPSPSVGVGCQTRFAVPELIYCHSDLCLTQPRGSPLLWKSKKWSIVYSRFDHCLDVSISFCALDYRIPLSMLKRGSGIRKASLPLMLPRSFPHPYRRLSSGKISLFAKSSPPDFKVTPDRLFPTPGEVNLLHPWNLHPAGLYDSIPVTDWSPINTFFCWTTIENLGVNDASQEQSFLE
jgi:hypothetical protein